MAGTLRIPPQSVGEFKVPAGVYQVRYRDGKSCSVRRGAPLHLTGPRAGVEIAIKYLMKTEPPLPRSSQVRQQLRVAPAPMPDRCVPNNEPESPSESPSNP